MLGLRSFAAVGRAGQVSLNIAGGCPVCVQLACGLPRISPSASSSRWRHTPCRPACTSHSSQCGRLGVDVLDPALRFPHAVTDGNGGSLIPSSCLKGFPRWEISFCRKKLHCRLYLVEVGSSALELALGSQSARSRRAAPCTGRSSCGKWSARWPAPVPLSTLPRAGLSLFQFRSSPLGRAESAVSRRIRFAALMFQFSSRARSQCLSSPSALLIRPL